MEHEQEQEIRRVILKSPLHDGGMTYTEFSIGDKIFGKEIGHIYLGSNVISFFGKSSKIKICDFILEGGEVIIYK